MFEQLIGACLHLLVSRDLGNGQYTMPAAPPPMTTTLFFLPGDILELNKLSIEEQREIW